jgi:hypothetical protein
MFGQSGSLYEFPACGRLPVEAKPDANIASFRYLPVGIFLMEVGSQ